MPGYDLADLDAFAAVARARSFRGAAALRGVSPSTLSEAVRRLEKHLGVRLLNRTTRSVTATEAGSHLLDGLGPALDAVEAALDLVNGFRDSPTGTLRLNVPTIVACHVLPPIAGGFLKAHPAITLEVTTDDRFIDVLAAGFDAGVRYDERLDQDMIAIPLGPASQRFACAASPTYLVQRGHPAHPRDLLEHSCIRHRFASGVMVSWEFARGSEIVRVDPTGPLVATSLDLEIAAAIDGLGIIETFEEFLRPALDAGLLSPVLEDWWETFSGPRLYYAGNRLTPAPLRAFIDFVKAWPRHASGHDHATASANKPGDRRGPSAA